MAVCDIQHVKRKVAGPGRIKRKTIAYEGTKTGFKCGHPFSANCFNGTIMIGSELNCRKCDQDRYVFVGMLVQIISQDIYEIESLQRFRRRAAQLR